MSQSTIDVIPGESAEQTALRVQVANLKAELEALKAKELRGTDRPLTLKVSAKGGLSVYGLGRFPVTLFKAQWRKLLAAADEISKYIDANEAALKDKSDETEEEAAARKAHVQEQLASVGRAPAHQPAPQQVRTSPTPPTIRKSGG